MRNIRNVDGASPIVKSGVISNSKSPEGGQSANVNMQIPETKEQIQTRKYIEAFIETNKSVLADVNATAEQKAAAQRVANVYKNVDYTINSDGSVRFNFKNDVNVEDFKSAFGISTGNLRAYLRKRHDEGLKDGTVHARYTNGASSDDEQRSLYETGGVGATIRYTDGYSETKGRRGGWINRSKIVDHPDYRNMSLGPADNQTLYTFGKSFFTELD